MLFCKYNDFIKVKIIVCSFNILLIVGIKFVVIDIMILEIVIKKFYKIGNSVNKYLGEKLVVFDCVNFLYF